jgi:Glyoxalase-like domain
MAGSHSTKGGSISPTGIDHLVYACADLQRGMDEIEALLGVRPVPGGRHPQYGTHNALLALGPGSYLEIIARDPDLPAPEQGALIDVPGKVPSRLVTWVLRVADIHQVAALAQGEGIGIGEVASGSRKNPDGSEIRWQLTDPAAKPMDGAVPFLINWGATVHPSLVVPPGGELVRLSIGHPRAGELKRALALLEADVETVESTTFRMTAAIRTARGLVELE